MPLTRARIDRRRLFPLIGDRRVTVIRAAAGSGKTSLVVDWLAQAEARPATAWVMLDEHSRSAASFWRRVIGTLVGHGLIAEGAIVARFLAGEADPSQATSLLIAELNGRPADLLLVVDDLHLLDDAGQAQLVHVLVHTHRLRLIAISRTRTLLDAAPATRIGLSVIGAEDLAVSLQELEAISAVSLPRAEQERLLEITRGHILALRLALSTVERARTGEGAEEGLLDTVAREMADSSLAPFISDHDLSRAVRLALSPVVDVPLARALLEEGVDAVALFDSFVERGAGQMSTRGADEAFVFHPLVRAALVSRARDTLDEETTRRLRLYAAHHLESAGDPIDVLELLVHARDGDRAWSYFVRQLSVLAVQRVEDVIRVLQTVPDGDLRRHGMLAVILAIGLAERAGRPTARIGELASWGLRHLDRQPESDDSLERCLHHAARLGAYRAVRRYDEAADAGDELAREFAALPPEERRRSGLHAAVMQSVVTSVLAGRLGTATDQGAALIDEADRGRRRQLSGMLTYIHGLRGDIARSRAHRDEIVDELASTWSRTAPGVGWRFGEAMISMEQGRFGDARAALEPLHYRAERFEDWPVLLWLDAHLHLIEGEVVLGHDTLSHALGSQRGRVAAPHHRDKLVAIRADLARAVDEDAHAHRILAEAPRGPASDLARARLLLAQGRPQDALDLARSANQHHDLPRRTAEAGLVTAVALGRLGLVERSASSFQHLGRVLRRYELTSPLVHLTREEAEKARSDLGLVRPPALADPYRSESGVLSPRELVVLRYLRADDSLPRIADRLHVSTNTVKSQVKSIYRKLGVTKRAAAVAAASERALL